MGASVHEKTGDRWRLPDGWCARRFKIAPVGPPGVMHCTKNCFGGGFDQGLCGFPAALKIVPWPGSQKGRRYSEDACASRSC